MDGVGRLELLFIRNLQHYRKERGWTPKDLAGETGFSVKEIMLIEQGNSTASVTLGMIRQLARALRLSDELSLVAVEREKKFVPPKDPLLQRMELLAKALQNARIELTELKAKQKRAPRKRRSRPARVLHPE